MPSVNKQWRWVRGLWAVGLSLLFCLISLAPLAAATALGSRCGSMTKCCCRKAHRSDGPALSTRACASRCGHMAPVSGSVTAAAPVEPSFAHPVICCEPAHRIASPRADTAPHSTSLHQRPPPPVTS